MRKNTSGSKSPIESLNLWVQESWVNATAGHRIGDSDVYESFTDDKGELYRAFVREHGRCQGRVYIDKDGKAQAIGWIFVKRRQYDDCNESYLAETWVTVHNSLPVKTITYDYAEVKQ